MSRSKLVERLQRRWPGSVSEECRAAVPPRTGVSRYARLRRRPRAATTSFRCRVLGVVAGATDAWKAGDDSGTAEAARPQGRRPRGGCQATVRQSSREALCGSASSGPVSWLAACQPTCRAFPSLAETVACRRRSSAVTVAGQHRSCTGFRVPPRHLLEKDYQELPRRRQVLAPYWCRRQCRE